MAPPPPPPSSTTPNPELQPPIRRGRGRPRKYPRLEDQQQQQQQQQVPLKKDQEEQTQVKKEEVEEEPKGPPLSFPGTVPKPEEEHGNGNEFFKIIHSHIIRNRKLAIPMSFVKKFSKDLTDFAILKAPRGPTWRVELKRGHRGDVWFRKGWHDFVVYHSISPTDFLIFRYDGNSQFHVLIFNVSGSEIDYLPSNNKGGPFVTVKKEIIDEEEEEYMNNNMAYVSPVTPLVNESSVKPKSNIINPVSKKKADEQKAEPKVEPKTLDFSALMETASQFKSEHPFFIVQMKPSYVNHKFVPVASAFDKSLMPGDRGWIKIRGSNGQEWSVGILASETRKEYRLSKGISAFLSDNDLKEGDVCVFELIKENEDDDIVLKAHIFQ